MTPHISDIEFERIVHDNQALIHKVCRIYCNNNADIDDLFQDIVFNLWKGISGFKGLSKISTWIYRISLNTAISFSNKRKKNRLLFTETPPERALSYSLSEQETRDSQITSLYTAINKLKPVEKAIILLYLEDRSYDEISEIIGINPKNVGVRLVRIRKKLRSIMDSLININD